MGGIADLIAWKEAAALAAGVFEAVKEIRGPNTAKVVDQMLRAANSIHANIAEGYGRGLTPDGIRFLRFAHASADELEGHLRVAGMNRQLATEVVHKLVDHTRRVGYLIHQYQKSVERRLPK